MISKTVPNIKHPFTKYELDMLSNRLPMDVSQKFMETMERTHKVKTGARSLRKISVRQYKRGTRVPPRIRSLDHVPLDKKSTMENLVRDRARKRIYRERGRRRRVRGQVPVHTEI